MMTLRPLHISVAAAVLALAGACATAPQPAGFAATSGAPAPIAGYDWFMHAEEGEAMLAYGVANSDEVKLHLACRIGTGRLDLTQPGHGDAREIHLESGGDTERFAAVAEPSEIQDGVLLTASTTADQPVFQRFRRLGWIAAWHGDDREAYAAHPGSTKGVADFFAACG